MEGEKDIKGPAFKAKLRFRVAEREGFEPLVEVSPHTRLAG
jgi:hypothetical protein